jgi:hypothetical protein
MASLSEIVNMEDKAETIRKVDLVVGVTGPVQAEELRARAADTLHGLVADMSSDGSPLRIAVAYPATEGDVAAPSDARSPVQFVPYPLHGAAARALPWLAVPAAHRGIAGTATASNARACLMIAEDLSALNRASIEALAGPLMEGTAQLTMPVYPARKYEGLVNSGILYPFTRALYGRQLRYPLALDFGVSGAMLSRLAAAPVRGQSLSICWPGVEGALVDAPTAQAFVAAEHSGHSEDLDLSTVLALLAGALFEEAEKNAAIWQRARGSRAVPVAGTPSTTAGREDAVDTRPLVDSFNLGLRNLQEVWSLVLPPVTLLELRKLARLPAEEFRIPDAVWAKTVYDFALAHRLRTISRAHLLGALTPLYLGWVASYAAEVRALDAEAAERRIERLAEAFEEAKSYFVSRWRWPDRFNP